MDDIIYLIEESYVSGEDNSGRDIWDERIMESAGYFTDRERAEQFIVDFHEREKENYDKRNSEYVSRLVKWEKEWDKIKAKFDKVEALAKAEGISLNSLTFPYLPPKPYSPNKFTPTSMCVIELEKNDD